MFKEKPDEETAKGYIAQGALWNGGVFAFKLGYVLDQARELLNYTTYQDLFGRYDTLTKISFDYAVVEKEKNIQVLRYSGQWKDIGTWNTLIEAMDENTMGPVTLNEQCRNVHAINELDIPLLVMNMQNVIVAASPQGILVTEPHASAHIKPFVDKIDKTARFAEKTWGDFVVLDIGEMSLTARLNLKAGFHIRYHSHTIREESWTVVSGQGYAVIDDVKYPLSPGVSLRLPVGSRHALYADTKLTVIEVQVGEEISPEDITYIKQ
jgi:mannose-1-phosphate guanylyltransferase